MQIGDLYKNGNGVDRDYKEAMKWFKKAADQGYAEGQDRIARMYYNGWGIERDYYQANSWFRKAADQDYAASENMLAIMYEEGEGVPKDYTEAIKYYRKAADHGFWPADENIGICYARGTTGVKKDLEEAIKWYKKAIDLCQDQEKGKLIRKVEEIEKILSGPQAGKICRTKVDAIIFQQTETLQGCYKPDGTPKQDMIDIMLRNKEAFGPVGGLEVIVNWADNRDYCSIRLFKPNSPYF